MARNITLALTGDVMLGRLVNATIARQGFGYPWGDVLPLLHGADLVLINLECALTVHTERWRGDGYKAFYFRAEPAAIATLKIARVAFASLANNHAGDYDTEGLAETIRVLDGAGIAHAGAGMDLAAARAPAILTADDVRVSVVAFADHPMAWAATPSSPGTNYTPVSLDPEDFGVVEECIAAARRGADLVIFTIHWGPNMRPRPTREFQDFARRVVTAGADIFWGHSAHLVQGIELYEGKLILYDTGDFVDDYAVDPELRNDLAALFLVSVTPQQFERVELVPVTIEQMQVNVARGRDREWFTRRLTGLCAEMGTALVTGPVGLCVVLPSVSERERAP